MKKINNGARRFCRAPLFYKKLYLFRVALAAGAGFFIAGAAHLNLRQSAVAALVVMPASCNVASYVNIYVIVHIITSNHILCRTR